MPIQSFCIKLYKSKNKDWQQGIFQNIESEVWLFCIRYGNNLDILLLRTNMSEWKVWVTMPQVPPAPSLWTLRYSTAVSRQPCLSVSAASVFVPAQRLNYCIVLLYFHRLKPPLSTLCTVGSPICTLWIVVSHMSSLECDSPALENLFPFPTMMHIHTDCTCTYCSIWNEGSGTRSFFNWLKGPGLPSPYFFCLWGSHISGSLFFAAKALTEIMLPFVGFATFLFFSHREMNKKGSGRKKEKVDGLIICNSPE